MKLKPFFFKTAVFALLVTATGYAQTLNNPFDFGVDYLPTVGVAGSSSSPSGGIGSSTFSSPTNPSGNSPGAPGTSSPGQIAPPLNSNPTNSNPNMNSLMNPNENTPGQPGLITPMQPGIQPGALGQNAGVPPQTNNAGTP